MRRRFLALGLAAMVALSAGCSGGGHPRAVAPTTTTTDPYEVPDVITVAYVNRVFAALNHVYGDAFRALLSTHSVSPGVLADLRSIFNDPLYASEVRVAQATVDARLTGLRTQPGDILTTVNDLISVSPRCIFVETSSSYASVQTGPPILYASEYWVLKPKQAGADPNHYNPTPWALSFNIDYETPTTIPDQC